MTIKEKFESIDQGKLKSEQVAFLQKIKTATKDFTLEDAVTNEKIGTALDKMISAFKESNPDAIKTKQEEKKEAPEQKAAPEKKATAKRTPAKRTGQTPAAKKAAEAKLAKEKEAEAKAQQEKAATEKKAEKKVKSEMEKLLQFVRRRKELKNISGTDIMRDARRQALPSGRRTSKEGNVYYEYDENRTDRTQGSKSGWYLENGGAFGAGHFAKGGDVSNERMYNFLKDDLGELEKAIEGGNTEEVDRFFSYWTGSYGHLKSLKTKTNDRMYNFLKDDLVELEKAIKDGNSEEVDRFFSYWGQHLESLKMENGGAFGAGHFAEGGLIGVNDIKKGASFRNDIGNVFVIDEVNNGMVKYHSEKFGKENYEYDLDQFVDIMKSQRAVKMENGGAFGAGHFENGGDVNSRKLIQEQEKSLEKIKQLKIDTDKKKEKLYGLLKLYVSGDILYAEEFVKKFKAIFKDGGSFKFNYEDETYQKYDLDDIKDIFNGKPSNDAVNFYDKAEKCLKDKSLVVYAGYGYDYFQNGGAFGAGHFADGGGVSDAPIGVMREIKGKSISVPVTGQTSTGEINRFIDYVFDYYDEQYSKQQVRTAVNKYLKDLSYEQTFGGGDSLDRERVFDKYLYLHSIEKNYKDGYITKMEFEDMKKSHEKKFANGGAFGAGHFAKGGSIKNQYEGKSAEQVWGEWNMEQKSHFLKDHFLTNTDYSEDKKDQVSETKYLKWNDLPRMVRMEVERHVFMGQYENGGAFGAGHFADGGSVSEDISECKKLVSAFCKEFGDKFGLDEQKILDGVKFQDYLGHGASVFVSLRVESNITDLKVGETKPTGGNIIFTSDINPNGVTGKDDIARTYSIDIEIKGSKRFTQRRTAEGTYFKSYNYGRTIEEAMDKTDTKIIYDLYPLEKKDNLKFQMSFIFANGGAFGAGHFKEGGSLATMSYVEPTSKKGYYELSEKHGIFPSAGIVESDDDDDDDEDYTFIGRVSYLAKSSQDDSGIKGMSREYVVSEDEEEDAKEEIEKMFFEEMSNPPFNRKKYEVLEITFKNKKMAMGGFTQMDLAGHLGGGYDFGRPTYLDGFTGTQYTGLVGETGALSSGEMFENGGAFGAGHFADGGETSAKELLKAIYEAQEKSVKGGFFTSYEPEFNYALLTFESIFSIRKQRRNSTEFPDTYFIYDTKYKYLGSADEIKGRLKPNVKKLTKADFDGTKFVAYKWDDAESESKAKANSSKKYVDHDDIASVTLKLNDKTVTLKGSDVLNGVNLEEGGELSKIAKYVKKADVLSVKLKNGETVKPLNGYWVKKDAEPINEKMQWQDAKRGDSARVKEINRMGLIIKAYGRKFHLQFPNGTEKTFDASELEFMDGGDKFSDGGAFGAGHFAKGGGLENDGYNLKDINGKKIKVGDTVKTTQPSGGLMSPSNSEIGIVEKTKDAFGNDALKIRYRKQGTNYDRFILLNGQINEIIEESGSNKKYVDQDDIESVTLNVSGNFVTFEGKDFLNGANLMEKGGDLSKIATYFPVRNIVRVKLKNGDTVKPLNGYWLKNGSEPMGKKTEATKTTKSRMVVSKLSEIPKLKESLDAGTVTYRGLGMGKLFDDFYDLAGTKGTRIKVSGKEYFITHEDFDSISRDSDGKLIIRFDAPYRKMENGGAFGAGHFMAGGNIDGVMQDASQSYVNYYLGEGAAQGIYAKGGDIGDTTIPIQVIIDGDWDEPKFFKTISLAKKFVSANVKNHELEIVDSYGDSIYVEKGSSKEDLDWLFGNTHTKGGNSYAKGGMLSANERYVLEMAGLTGLRKEAILNFISENSLTESEVLNIVIGLGRRQIKGTDVSTAVVGTKNNKYAKEVIAFAKSDKALKAEFGGSFGAYN